VISTDSFVTIGAGLMIGGAVVFGWWQSWGSWDELRSDWRDFRAAAIGARENKRERKAFAHGRRCPECRRAIEPRRLFRAVHAETSDAAGIRWVYRCRCGEGTLYDRNGDAHHLEPSSAA